MRYLNMHGFETKVNRVDGIIKSFCEKCIILMLLSKKGKFCKKEHEFEIDTCSEPKASLKKIHCTFRRWYMSLSSSILNMHKSE